MAWIDLDGAVNVRDLGGLPTTDGGRTLPNRILRSDNLQTLSDADVQLLVEEIGLREVIDLRTSAEVLLEGRGPLRSRPEITHRHFTLLPERGARTDVFAAEEDDDEVRRRLPTDWGESLLPRQTAPGADGESPAVRSYLGYLTDGRDNVLAALRDRGVPLLSEPADRPWGHRTLHVADPDGFVVEFAQEIPRSRSRRAE